MHDHVLKPDLVAPGNRFIAATNADSRLRTAFPGRARSCGQSCTTNYLELSGSSMAAAEVSGAALLMLTRDSTLSPATVKARLMRSARKMSNIDATALGAGVLNVNAALGQTGVVTGQALSPLMKRSSSGSAIMVEDTAQLWGNSAWSAGYLWSDGYLWSNNYTQSNGYLWSDGYLWQNGYLWSNGYLWNNGYLWDNGYLWSNGYLWDNGYLWSNGYLWNNSADGADATEAELATTAQSASE
jgi:serine protease AprX